MLHDEVQLETWLKILEIKVLNCLLSRTDICEVPLIKELVLRLHPTGILLILIHRRQQLCIRLVAQRIFLQLPLDSRLAFNHLSSWHNLNGVIPSGVRRLLVNSTAREVHDQMLLGF